MESRVRVELVSFNDNLTVHVGGCEIKRTLSQQPHPYPHISIFSSRPLIFFVKFKYNWKHDLNRSFQMQLAFFRRIQNFVDDDNMIILFELNSFTDRSYIFLTITFLLVYAMTSV
jgi:hypothetical protein